MAMSTIKLPYLSAPLLERAKRATTALTREVDVIENESPTSYAVSRLGMGPVENDYGSFWQLQFAVDDYWRHYHVIAAADVDGELNLRFNTRESVMLRIDSGCLTGQVFDDRSCECRAQLFVAMTEIQRSGGLIIHIPDQDGRGMGTGFKLSTLLLQQEGNLDTHDAAKVLASNGNIDRRTYSGAIAVLKFLGISPGSRLRFMTNNPDKIRALNDNGYIVERVPVTVPATTYTARHLLAKKQKMGHLG